MKNYEAMFVYGDSFVRCDNLEDEEVWVAEEKKFVAKPNTYHVNREKSWPRLLSQKLDTKVINKGVAGAGPMEIAMCAVKDFKYHNENTLILVGLTSPYRLPMPTPDYRAIFYSDLKVVEHYARRFRLFDHDTLLKYMVMFYKLFDLIQQGTKADIYFINLWYDYEERFYNDIIGLGQHLTWNAVINNKPTNSLSSYIVANYDKIFGEEIQFVDGACTKLYLPCGHFNELMCEVVADEVYDSLQKSQR